MKNGMVLSYQGTNMKLSELLLERKEDGVNVDDKGTKRYYRNNVLYREEFADGSKFWYLNGKPHRVDGPAIEWAKLVFEWVAAS